MSLAELWYHPGMATLDDPVLARLRATLDQLYGDRLERVVLYGSRARGDARPDSDYDVAVFLTDVPDLWQESGRLAEIETEIILDTGAVVHAMPMRAGAYQDRTLFMHEVRKDGLTL